jgi:hypothetical protein
LGGGGLKDRVVNTTCGEGGVVAPPKQTPTALTVYVSPGHKLSSVETTPGGRVTTCVAAPA